MTKSIDDFFMEEIKHSLVRGCVDVEVRALLSFLRRFRLDDDGNIAVVSETGSK